METPRTLCIARSVGALITLLLAFDVYTKIAKPPAIVEGFKTLGVQIALAPLIAAILAVVTVLYLIPRTRILGATLLTGYLGGAVAINLRGGDPLFEVVFPILFGVAAWAPVWLTNCRLRALFPLVANEHP